MKNPWIALLPLALFACTPDGGDTSGDTDDSNGGDTDTVDTDTAPCTATVTQLIPLDGSLGVGADEGFSVAFSEAVDASDVQVTLVAADTTPVEASAQLASDGLSAAIDHAALALDTTYTLTVDVCESSASSAFTTTSGPVDEAIETRAYALDFADVDFVSPSWASAFKSMLPLEYVLVEIEDVDMALQELDGAGAIGFADDTTGEIYQGACYDPMVYNNIDFSENPSFEVGPSDLYIPNGNLTFYDLKIQAAFADGGDSLVGIDITGQVDARQIQENVPAIDACAWAEAANDTCVPCESDGQPYCLDLWMTADEAPYVPGLDVDPTYVAADDPRCP